MTPMLDQIREGEAPAAVAGIYRDIRQELRSTYVPLFFRVLAVHRGCLRAVWDQLRPNVATQAFEALSDELRARLAVAAVDLGTPLIEPVLTGSGFDVDDLDDLREQVDLFHYVDPKTLLCVGAVEGLAEGVRVGGSPVPRELLRPIPPGAPVDVPDLALLPEEPGGVMGELLHIITHTLGLPSTEIDLRALGHWPAFVDVAWREVGSPLFRHPSLPATLDRLQSTVRHLAGQLPFPIDGTQGALAESPDALVAATRIVSTLRVPVLRLALFAASLKVALDGAQEARGSPFPVEWEQPSIDQIEV
jgi:hypothetical protein